MIKKILTIFGILFCIGILTGLIQCRFGESTVEKQWRQSLQESNRIAVKLSPDDLVQYQRCFDGINTRLKEKIITDTEQLRAEINRCNSIYAKWVE